MNQDIKSAVESTIRAVAHKENISQKDILNAFRGHDSYLRYRIKSTLNSAMEELGLSDHDIHAFMQEYLSHVKNKKTYIGEVLNIENLEEEEKDDMILLSREHEFMALEHDEKIDYILETMEEYPYFLELYGKELELANEYEKAIDLYNTILDNDPESVLAHIGLGYIYKSQGNTTLARLHLNNALEWIINTGSDIPCLVQEIKKALKDL
ncbi:MAG: hypothetical protein R6V53_04845 [Candidatus Woesearchaeota archaeon]